MSNLKLVPRSKDWFLRTARRTDEISAQMLRDGDRMAHLERLFPKASPELQGQMIDEMRALEGRIHGICQVFTLREEMDIDVEPGADGDFPIGPSRYYVLHAEGSTAMSMLMSAVVEEVETTSGKVYRDKYLSQYPVGSEIYRRAVEMVAEKFGRGVA